MVDVHDRRPVVLSSELARQWAGLTMPKEQTEQLVLNLGEGPETFEWYRVGVAVGNTRNQGVHLLDSTR
ncbi:putative SOS response-associated peptidase YedK [compost metagenome]